MKFFDVSKVVNRRTGSLKRLDPPRLGAGRKQKPIVSENPAIAGRDGLSLRIACDDGGSGDHADVEHVRPVVDRFEIGNRRLQRRKQFLRQLRPLIWWMLFLADQRD